MKLYPRALDHTTNSGLSVYDLAEHSHFCPAEIKGMFSSMKKTKEAEKATINHLEDAASLTPPVGETSTAVKTTNETKQRYIPVVDTFGRHEIHKCIKKGNGDAGGKMLLECVQKLVENEPECVKLRDEEGETPLHYAAYYGKHTLIPYLLSVYPDAAKVKTYTMEYTPLQLAQSVSNFSNKECVRMLLEENVEETINAFRERKKKK